MMPALTASLLTMGSVLATGAVLGRAWYEKGQFYPGVVYLVRSQSSMAVLYVQAFVAVFLLGRLVKAIFFGTLRASETENLMEKAWYAVTETCLAFTVFRDDFSPRFVAQFTLLLFLKCFHWLGEERVDVMERSPVISLLFHARMMSLMGVLSACDSYLMSHAYFTTLLRGASVQIVFGFEYAVLISIVFHLAIKYILHSIDLRSATPWEGKAVHLLHAEIIIGFFRVLLYAVFVLVMVRLHTFPLFSIRPMYLTIRSFKKACHDVIMSRRAIHAMNHLFADATEADLAPPADPICIVCREEMSPGAKKLPCGHIFHTACLRSWFQRQQTCPTCRTDILGLNNNNNSRQVRAPQAQQAPQPPPQPQAQTQVPPMPTPAANAATSSAPGGAASPTTPPMGFPPPLPGFPTFPPTLGAGGFPQPPSFPGLPPPFPLPFPAPPSFAGLSDAEVAAMEGSSRAAVEARVTALRNIATLLEAATLQLQQYTATLGALTATPAFAAPTRIAPESASPPTANAAAASSSVKKEEASVETPNSPAVEASHSGHTPSNSADSTPANSPVTAAEEEDEDEASIIRNRRLKALSSRQDSQSPPAQQ